MANVLTVWMRRLLVLVLPLVLMGCAAQSVWAPDSEVQQASYRHNGPPSITLFTVINNRSGSGAHSGLMVNGSQRLLFDPAGSFKHPQLPERNDVLFGMNDRAVAVYIDYHARETFHVVQQDLVVSPEQAVLIQRLVQEYGAVPPASCTTSITNILRQVPGFENFQGGLFPIKAMNGMADIPGVVTSKHFDDTPDRRGELVQVPRVR